MFGTDQLPDVAKSQMYESAPGHLYAVSMSGGRGA